MTLWRVEWLRLTRTRRWVALAGVYAFFALLGPVTARYANQIVQRFGTGGDSPTVTFPPATPVDGIASYVKNASQIGVLVLVVVAAGALAFDAKPALATFYRTRVRSASLLIVPRFTVNALAGSAAFTAGSVIAWYETVVLIGHPRAAALAEGVVLEDVYLTFAVAVVALSSTLVRSQLNTVMLSLGVLLALPILGLVRGVAVWIPSYLVGAPDGLTGGAGLTSFVRAAAVSVAATVGALWWAIARSNRREI